MGILETELLAANEDVTRIRLELSREDVNQGAFARAVFPQQRMDLARMQHEVHAFQCLCITEAFADAASKDDRMNAHFSYRMLNSPCKVLAAFRGNNVIANIFLSINCCTGIDILDLFAFKDIQQESDCFIALFFWSLIDRC